ncbi:catechol 2,3-dioxygenase-like lactoylglutathione lyase family enzyme [Caballeronia udeis]|uniref:Catechol 2,3-dioxygenase-like lactoylglutathione lyase family enzyme n=1 Tax=Caballeronia udeis TaxID=1232866 RepID=A0ABW8MUB4_9BURK
MNIDTTTAAGRTMMQMAGALAWFERAMIRERTSAGLDAGKRKEIAMLKQAIPNIFVKDFQAALAYYTGPLGFHPLFVYGETPFYAHVARDEAILAIRHVTRPVIDHTAGEELLSAFVEVSDVNALHDSLQAAGAHIWQAPRDEPWAMRSLIVSDLDGNLICFAFNLAR